MSEIFLSMQGEGAHAGTPSVFLRTYYCNLTCDWCDTKYTWLNQTAAKEGSDYRLMTVDAVISEVLKHDCQHLVLTGGEPLMHQVPLLPVLTSLKNRRFFVEVETNGTFVPTPEFAKQIDCFNVSPKTSNSGVAKSTRTRPEALRALAESDKAWFKFVVREEGDLTEVESMVSEFSIRRDRVMLMPEGTDWATLSNRAKWLVGVCERTGFRFAPRLQILLFGNRRGT